MEIGVWPVVPDVRIVQWLATMSLLERFVDREKRLPRENRRLPREEISNEERALADWVRYQRRSASVERHSQYQQLRLQFVPGFKWAPKEQHWNSVLADFEQFVDHHGRAPRYRSDDTDEKALAAWASKQRTAMRAGKLSPLRIAKLDAIRFRVLPPRTGK